MTKWIVLVSALSLLGCSTKEPPPPPAAPPTEIAKAGDVSIEENTQATIGDLKIGVGNIWDETYKDASGAEKTGLTAGVWTYIRNDDTKNATMRVYPGKTFTAGDYKVEVKAVHESSIVVVFTR